ncbi:phage holin family protein [Morganella morganii]|nr:phage holin family protein [Morganella morganii]
MFQFIAYIWGLITSTLGIVSLNQWATVAGVIRTVGTFLVNRYNKRKEFQLKAGGMMNVRKADTERNGKSR